MLRAPAVRNVRTGQPGYRNKDGPQCRARPFRRLPTGRARMDLNRPKGIFELGDRIRLAQSPARKVEQQSVRQFISRGEYYAQVGMRLDGPLRQLDYTGAMQVQISHQAIEPFSAQPLHCMRRIRCLCRFVTQHPKNFTDCIQRSRVVFDHQNMQ